MEGSMRFLRLKGGLVVYAMLMAPAVCHAQHETPVCIMSGFDAEGPIIVGTITRAQLNLAKGSPSITLSISQYIRGPKFEGDSVEVMVDRTESPNQPVMSPQIWQKVRPEVGKRVLLMFWKDGTRSFSPVCVLDMDSPDGAAAKILERMVGLSQLPVDKKLIAMQAAISDPELAIRSMAVNYLTSPALRDPDIRLFVFEHFAPIALDTTSPSRTEALESIKSAYDGFSEDSPVNYRILSFIADRMVDPDSMIRSVAVQCLDSMFFGGGKNRPELARIIITDRASIIRQLREDIASDEEFADQARRVLGLLISPIQDK
jgi:hypothetical protein